MVMVGVDSGSRHGLAAQVVWLGLRVGSRLAPFYIHHMNRVNSRKQWFCHGDGTINIDICIIFCYFLPSGFWKKIDTKEKIVRVTITPSSPPEQKNRAAERCYIAARPRKRCYYYYYYYYVCASRHLLIVMSWSVGRTVHECAVCLLL